MAKADKKGTSHSKKREAQQKSSDETFVIGIVLSGTGTDGTEGVVAIKKAGGLVIVQDPATAKYDGMPRNAINTGYADFVLDPELILNEIFNYVKVSPIASEVTELVNSENEFSFFLILDSSPNAIITLQTVRDKSDAISDFELKVMNRKAQDWLGLTEKELIGRTLLKEWPDLLGENMAQRLANVVETGEQLELEQLQLHNGEENWLHIVAVKFGDGLVLTLQDITARKLNEQELKLQQEENRLNAERFRTVLEAVPLITWTNKPSGENESFNADWYTYTGLTKAESEGWGWIKAFHPDDLESQLPRYKEHLLNGKVFNTQARIKRKADNQYRYHLIKVIPLYEEETRLTLWVGTATDIQDYKDAEEANIKLRLSQHRELLKAVLQAQEAERQNISEALHNGLGQVLYATKLNLDQLNPQTKQEKTIKSKVDELLKESIQLNRNISFELTPSVLKDFGLKAALKEIISRFNTPKLKITLNMTGFDKKIDSFVELSLYRIIQELLNNIIKHSQATKATIDLTCKDNEVTLIVKDNGVGLDKDVLHSMKGIGLRSIQHRLELLSGKLTTDTKKGKGTTFKLECTI